MCCHGLKGGIGSSSRLVELDGKTFVVGALVLTNFGRLDDLVVVHDPIGCRIIRWLDAHGEGIAEDLLKQKTQDRSLRSSRRTFR